MPEFDGTPGLLTMMAAITGETSGINMAAYESKEAVEAVEEKNTRSIVRSSWHDGSTSCNLPR